MSSKPDTLVNIEDFNKTLNLPKTIWGINTAEELSVYKIRILLVEFLEPFKERSSCFYQH
jgi:hypothetical protein